MSKESQTSSSTPSSRASRSRFLAVHGIVCGVAILSIALYVMTGAINMGQGLIDFVLMVAVASHVGVSSLGVLIALWFGPRVSWLWGIHFGTPLVVAAGAGVFFAYRAEGSAEEKRRFFEERERKMALPADEVRLLDSWTRRSGDGTLDWVVDVEVSLPGRFETMASRTGESPKVWGECAPDHFQVSRGQPEGYRRQIVCKFPSDAVRPTDGWRFQITELGENPRRLRAFVAVSAVPKKIRLYEVEVSAPAVRSNVDQPGAEPAAKKPSSGP